MGSLGPQKSVCRRRLRYRLELGRASPTNDPRSDSNQKDNGQKRNLETGVKKGRSAMKDISETLKTVNPVGNEVNVADMLMYNGNQRGEIAKAILELSKVINDWNEYWAYHDNRRITIVLEHEQPKK